MAYWMLMSSYLALSGHTVTAQEGLYLTKAACVVLTNKENWAGMTVSFANSEETANVIFSCKADQLPAKASPPQLSSVWR